MGFREIAVPFPAVARILPVLRNVLSGARPIAYSIRIAGQVKRVKGAKRSMRETEYPVPAAAKVKDEWSYISSPSRLHGVHRDNFAFYSLQCALFCRTVLIIVCTL